MTSLRGLTFNQIAFAICTAFDREKVIAVLVGGGAATFYAPKAYQTRDLDFVLPYQLFGYRNISILDSLGFVPSNAAGTYQHPDIPYTLEVMKGPLGIGDELLASYDTCRRGDEVLYIIIPTDAVKDRLAHAIHFRDLSSANQAAEIARVQAVDLQQVRLWCENEGGSSIFRMFETLLGQ